MFSTYYSKIQQFKSYELFLYYNPIYSNILKYKERVIHSNQKCE